MKLFASFLMIFLLGVSFPEAQTPSDFIVVDQFGYLPDAPKKAVIRNPQVGFDASESFTPGTSYQLIDSESEEVVFSGSPQMWNRVIPILLLGIRSGGSISWKFRMWGVITLWMWTIMCVLLSFGFLRQ